MLNFYNKTFASRLLIGSALYPSPKIMQDAIRASGARHRHRLGCGARSAGGKTGDAFWSLIRELDVTAYCSIPPAAAACAKAVIHRPGSRATIVAATSWIKLEVIADNDTLQPST